MQGLYSFAHVIGACTEPGSPRHPDGPDGGESTPQAPSNPTPSGGTNPGSDDQGTTEDGPGTDD